MHKKKKVAKKKNLRRLPIQLSYRRVVHFCISEVVHFYLTTNIPKRSLKQAKKAIADYQKARMLLKEIGLLNHVSLVKRLKER